MSEALQHSPAPLPAPPPPHQGTPQQRWLAVFPGERTRLIIRGIRQLANVLAAPMHRERDRLREREAEARKMIADLQRERLELLTAAIEQEEAGCEAATVEVLLKRATKMAGQIQTLQRQRAEDQGARLRLISTQPFGGRLLDDLDRTLADWRRRVDPWPHIADLVAEADRAHRTVLDIIADHAVAWAWRGDAPLRWLSHAGYRAHVEPADDTAEEDQQQWIRLLRDHDIEPPIPAGTVLSTLTPQAMSITEYSAVIATRRGRRKANEALWQQWLDQMEDSLSEADRTAYAARAKAWRDCGWAGRRAAAEWLVALVARTGLSRPKLLPEFVAVRWPAPRGPLRYIDLGRDVVVLTPEELLVEDQDAGETPPASPSPPPAPKLWDAAIVVLDTETTGRDALAEVVEFGAVVLDRWGNEIGHFAELARPLNDPNRPAAREALAFNGIKLAQLRTARPVALVAADFRAWLRQWSSPVVTAYNIPFDRRMLARHAVEPVWGADIMRVSKKLDPGKGGLEGVSQRWGLSSTTQAHRALSDARLAAAVLIEAMRRLMAAAPGDAALAEVLRETRASFTPPPAQTRRLL